MDISPNSLQKNTDKEMVMFFCEDEATKTSPSGMSEPRGEVC